jgi:hypothetical protein
MVSCDSVFLAVLYDSEVFQSQIGTQNLGCNYAGVLLRRHVILYAEVQSTVTKGQQMVETTVVIKEARTRGPVNVML